MVSRKKPTPADDQAPAKKTAASKPPAKAAPAGKAAPAKKAAAKKAAATKAAAVKTPAAKPAAKKAAAKTAAAKKPAAPKSPAAKAAPRKAPAKKAAGPAAKAKPAARKRSSAEDANLDPARQLDKLDADPPAPPRARSRGAAPARPQPVVAGLPADFFAGFTGEPLNEAAMVAAAQSLGCEVAAIKAVAEVESRGSGFDSQGRPTVLYERHVFSRNCTPKGKFDSMPDISAPTGYGRGNYGNTESQWQKLAKAFALDPVAALKAPSWGTFQVLGENHKACGFADVREFVRLMITSPVGHLQVFVSFIRANPNLLRAIRALDWESFARGYNGKDFKTFGYDAKMAAAYARHSAAG
jgi:N-acetylmuramidase